MGLCLYALYINESLKRCGSGKLYRAARKNRYRNQNSMLWLEQRYALKAKRYDFRAVVSRVSEIMDIAPDAVLSRSRSPQTVKPRSLLCYWANRELGMTTVELSKQLRISQPTASKASQRGERIVMENGFKL